MDSMFPVVTITPDVLHSIRPIISPFHRDSYLVSLPELYAEVYQMLNPNEAVRILVTDVEHLLKLREELQQLLVVRENRAIHPGRRAASRAFTEEKRSGAERQAPSSSPSSKRHL